MSHFIDQSAAEHGALPYNTVEIEDPDIFTFFEAHGPSQFPTVDDGNPQARSCLRLGNRLLLLDRVSNLILMPMQMNCTIPPQYFQTLCTQAQVTLE